MTTPTKNEIKKFAAKRGETAHYSGKLKKFFFRKFSSSVRLSETSIQSRMHNKSYLSRQDLTPRQELTRKRKGKK